MRTDALVSFLPVGSPAQSMVGGAGVAIQIGNIIDLIGQGVGQPPGNIIGNASVFGTDVGIGGVKPQVELTVGTAFTTGTAATLDVYFEGAEDTGAAGNYQPGAWQVFSTTGPLTAAQLTAGTVFGRFDFPPAFPANFNPRYLRLLGVVPAATDFTAGTITNAIVTHVRDDQANKFAAGNYKVS